MLQAPKRARQVCYKRVFTCQAYFQSLDHKLLLVPLRGKQCCSKELALTPGKVTPYHQLRGGRLCSARKEQVWVAKGKRICSEGKQSLPSQNAMKALIPATEGCAKEPGTLQPSHENTNLCQRASGSRWSRLGSTKT